MDVAPSSTPSSSLFSSPQDITLDEITALASLLSLGSDYDSMPSIDLVNTSVFLTDPALASFGLPAAEAQAAAALQDLEARKRAGRLAELLANNDDDAIALQVLDATGLPEEIRRQPEEAFDLDEAMRMSGIVPPTAETADDDMKGGSDRGASTSASAPSSASTDRVNVDAGGNIHVKDETYNAFEDLLGSAAKSNRDGLAPDNPSGTKRGRQHFEASKFDRTIGSGRSEAGVHDAAEDVSAEMDSGESTIDAYSQEIDAIQVGDAALQLRLAAEAALQKRLEKTPVTTTSEFSM
jgi:hypothetical protein